MQVTKEDFDHIIANFNQSPMSDDQFFEEKYQLLYNKIKVTNPNYKLETFKREMSLFVHPDKLFRANNDFYNKVSDTPFKALNEFCSRSTSFPQFNSHPSQKLNNIDSFINRYDALFTYNNNLFLNALSLIKDILIRPLQMTLFLINLPSNITFHLKGAFLTATFLIYLPEEKLQNVIFEAHKKILLDYSPETDLNDLSGEDCFKEYGTHMLLILEIINKLDCFTDEQPELTNLSLLAQKLVNKYNLSAYFDFEKYDDPSKLASHILQLLVIIDELETRFPDIPRNTLFINHFPTLINNQNTTWDIIVQNFSTTSNVNFNTLCENFLFTITVKYLIFKIIEVINEQKHFEMWTDMSKTFYEKPFNEQLLSVLYWSVWELFFVSLELSHFILSSITKSIEFIIKCVEAALLIILSSPIHFTNWLYASDVNENDQTYRFAI